MYLLTIETQTGGPGGDDTRRFPANPNPQVDLRLDVGAHPPISTRPTSPQYRFVPQTPIKDEPFIIVMSGAKQHTRAATMKHDMNQTVRNHATHATMSMQHYDMSMQHY